MLSPSQIETVRQFASEVAEREGCQLYDLEFHDGPGRALRVYIDKAGGVSIEDCANVSRALNLRLDVEDVISIGAYSLEVSSPGLDRKLSQRWHYEAAVEKTVRVKFRVADKNQTVEGKLVSLSEEEFNLKNVNGEWSVPFVDVIQARIVPENPFAKNNEPVKKTKKR